jgi:hypothetical protein
LPIIDQFGRVLARYEVRIMPEELERLRAIARRNFRGTQEEALVALRAHIDAEERRHADEQRDVAA